MCRQPHSHNPVLSIQIVRQYFCVIVGSADSTAEQQLHDTEAVQNTFAPSHFPLLWSDPLLVVIVK